MRFRDLLPRRRVNVSAPEALARVSQGALLLDVRTQGEWDREHAAAAVHMPLDALNARMAELDPRREIVAICTAGFRSAIAANRLRAAGYTAHSLRTGMPGWRSTGEPMIGHR